jgi:pentapeptide MXKDX repeat protein
MTISTRVALGISAAALSLGLALAPAAFADDPMQQDITFRDSVSKEATKKDDVTKKDDGVKDGRKKRGNRRQ